MVVEFAGVSARRSALRALALVGTALGSTLVITPANAQNITSTTNTTDYTLVETGTRSGGPRTIDVATSGGNILIDVGTVNADNNTANNPNNIIGGSIFANNTGPGSVTIRDINATVIGNRNSNGIDARSTSGAVNVTSTGTINVSGTNTARGINANSGTGDVTVTSNEINAVGRGISTFTNGTTTINSGTTTASGTGLINAIVAQGNRVVLTAGNTSITNAAGNNGTAIFVNTDVGGALINAGTTSAFGQNQSALQVFSEGAVDVTSGTIRTTQSSDGLSIQGGTEIVVRSGTVATEGGTGAYGIVLGANRGGGGFNGDANGFAYTSANVTSDTVTTAGANSYGIYATPNGTGSTTITSNNITTAGSGATGILVNPIGTGTLAGTLTINSTGALNTNGANAVGIQTQNSTGTVVINNSGTITTANSRGIVATANSGDISITSNNISVGGANQTGILVGGFSQPATAANVSITNTGTLSTTGTTSTGIQVQSGTGTTSITNNGTINASGFGISILPTSGPVTIAGTGSINSTNVGVLVNNGAAPISITTGAITTTGLQGTGVQVSNNGATSITTGPIVTSGAQAGGISATGINGAITINASDTRSAGANTNAAIAANQTAGAVGAITVTTGIVRGGTSGLNLSGGTNPNAIVVNATDTQTVSGAIQATTGGAIFITSGTAQSTGTGATLTAITGISSAGLDGGRGQHPVKRWPRNLCAGSE